MTQVPYEKGALFLRHLEQVAGRERFDAFLRGYFDHFAFRSITTADFLAYLSEHLLADEALAGAVAVDEWVRAPGLPPDARRPASEAFDGVETAAARWAAGELRAAGLETTAWTTHEWLHFLAVLPARLGRAQMAELDAAFALTESPNAEIAHQWLLLAIRNAYAPAEGRLERYLLGIGRRKLILPPLRRARRHRGRPRAGARHLPAGPTGLSPDRHRIDRSAPRVGRIAPPDLVARLVFGPSAPKRRAGPAFRPIPRSMALRLGTSLRCVLAAQAPRSRRPRKLAPQNSLRCVPRRRLLAAS